MKKIAIIEDRYKRQQVFLNQMNFTLESYSNLLDNFVEEAAGNVLENILNDNFSMLSEYEIIICHKSVEYKNANIKILGNLRNYCKKTAKALIFFSGGISVNHYDNSEFEFLELNSKTFYSQNLKLFLAAVQDGTADILMLCYGEHWEDNTVANVLEKTNLFLFDIQNGYENPVNFNVENDLQKIDYQFYEIKEKTYDAIVCFKDSLEGYFQPHTPNSLHNKSVIIHSDNICNPKICDYHVKFKQSDDEIDVYITEYIIDELLKHEFDILFIKDNLSSNYLELYGLRVAYHVRFSSQLGSKRFVPIVIISDFDAQTLNKFKQEAAILFTDGVYTCKNTKEEIQMYQSLALKGLSKDSYYDFLQQIRVEPPKDTSGSHDIANQWSIYRWAEALKVDSEVIMFNREKIDNNLYFKYLKALFSAKNNDTVSIMMPTKKGKVLLIDDEWNKGWSDVIQKAIHSEHIEFTSLNYEYKDKEFTTLSFSRIKMMIEQHNPDVVILDLRLAQSDHSNDDIDSYSGVKILQKIHEINAGIQVIMLTATSKSTTLEKLYEKKILGYIKKEHPNDSTIDTADNINKLVSLVDKGLERKYLKDLFVTQHNIIEILSKDIFAQYNLTMDFYEPFWIKLGKEASNIFDIVDNGGDNRFIYAMVSIASSLETIVSIFIKENKKGDDQFWDNQYFFCEYKNIRCKLNCLFNEKFGYDKDDIDMLKLITKRNDYLHSRKSTNVNYQEIISWFGKLHKMVQLIQEPPKLKKYDVNNSLNNLQNKFS